MPLLPRSTLKKPSEGGSIWTPDDKTLPRAFSNTPISKNSDSRPLVTPHTLIYTDDGQVKAVKITGSTYAKMPGVKYRRQKDACSRCLWHISRCDLTSAIHWSKEGHVLTIPRCEKMISVNSDKCGRCLGLADPPMFRGICMEAVGLLWARAYAWEKALSLFAKSGGTEVAWNKLIDAQKGLAEVIKSEAARKIAVKEKINQKGFPPTFESAPKESIPANEPITSTSSRQLLDAVTGATAAISGLTAAPENTPSIAVSLDSIATAFTQFAADYRVVHQATLQAHTLGSIECDEAKAENTAGDSEMETEV